MILWIGTTHDGLWRLDIRGNPSDCQRPGRLTQVKGLPDQNVTALAAGERGDLYAGLGDISPNGGDSKGGMVRIDSAGKMTALDQGDDSKLAPFQLFWQDGMLWEDDIGGARVFNSQKDGRWSWLSKDRQVRLDLGLENRLIMFDVTWRPYAAYLFSPASNPPTLCAIACPGNLLTESAIETTDYYCFQGAILGSKSKELQCLQKRSGHIVTLDEQAGAPFSSVEACIWFGGKLWLATGQGLISIDAIHFPTDARAAAAIRAIPR
jgi:hypothetical protein